MRLYRFVAVALAAGVMFTGRPLAERDFDLLLVSIAINRQCDFVARRVVEMDFVDERVILIDCLIADRGDAADAPGHGNGRAVGQKGQPGQHVLQVQL